MLDNNSASVSTEPASYSSPPLTILATKNGTTLDEDLSIRTNDPSSVWRMRWYFFWVGIALSIFWMTAMIALNIYIFSVTRSFFSLLISAASALIVEFMRRFANYLLPMDDKTFELEKMRIQMKIRK